MKMVQPPGPLTIPTAVIVSHPAPLHLGHILKPCPGNSFHRIVLTLKSQTVKLQSSQSPSFHVPTFPFNLFSVTSTSLLLPLLHFLRVATLLWFLLPGEDCMISPFTHFTTTILTAFALCPLLIRLYPSFFSFLFSPLGERIVVTHCFHMHYFIFRIL